MSATTQHFVLPSLRNSSSDLQFRQSFSVCLDDVLRVLTEGRKICLYWATQWLPTLAVWLTVA